MTDTPTPLTELVGALPEVYQPIYGHPRLSLGVSRFCEDRLTHILAVHDSLRDWLGRPLRVLDLGCAQGYFSLHLAERGAQVVGIDRLAANIDVCQALAAEHPDWSLCFRVGQIEDVLRTLPTAAYDLVLGLSVFHHIIFERGLDETRDLLSGVARRVSVVVCELARRDEPLAWATAQPEDPRDLLAGFAFIHELARHPTHLSSIPRPLYVASHQCWLLHGQIGAIDAYRTAPHALAEGIYGGSRQYFFSGDRLIKVFRLDHPQGERNREEITREADFLANPPPGFVAPVCHDTGASQGDIWLIRTMLPGTLLLDRLSATALLDHEQILRDILCQLIALESVGLWHGDVRTWNVLLTDEGRALLLDYGSISPQKRDLAWPENPYLSLFVFVRELVEGRLDSPEPLRAVALGPWSLPSDWRAWGLAIWKYPPEHWSFRLMLEQLDRTPPGTPCDPPSVADWHWAMAIEQALERQSRFMKNLHWEQTEIARLQTLEREYQRLHGWSQELEQTLSDKDGRIAQLECLVSHLEAETDATEARAVTAEAQMHALLNSLSWRVTAPLRVLAGRSSGWRFERIRATPRSALAWLARQVLARPWAATLAWRLLRYMPRLHARLSRALLVATPAREADWPAETAQIARLRRALHTATHPLD